MTKISDSLNNINIASANECNLLCKLIIDYIPSNKISLTTNEFKIGSGSKEKNIF